MKKFILLTMLAVALSGCSSEVVSEDLPPVESGENMEDTILRLPDLSDDSEEVLKSPALESFYLSARAVVMAGPDSDVSEEEFGPLVAGFQQELENLLNSHSYEGNETVDGFLVSLLNVSPERHEGMGPDTYAEYYGAVSSIAMEGIEWASN